MTFGRYLSFISNKFNIVVGISIELASEFVIVPDLVTPGTFQIYGTFKEEDYF